MAKNTHNPSLMRRIRRELKEGQDPEVLLPRAKAISDPYYRSLSLYLVIPHLNQKSKSCKSAITLANNEIDQVQQPWRRIELLGSITKLLKSFPEIEVKTKSYSMILSKLDSEKKVRTRDFLLNYSKNFPETFLEELLHISNSLEGSEFETGKAIIRHWINLKSHSFPVDKLINFKGQFKTKLLGYLHFQLSKSNKYTDSFILSKAVETVDSQESLKYLVRVCSTISDIELIENYISDFSSEEKIPILLSLISRADRKNFKEKAKEMYIETEEEYENLIDSRNKSKFREKMDLTLKRLEGEQFIKNVKQAEDLHSISSKGKHTLALYNTYGGNWNHPHFKAIFKASNLCAAFDLDLALISFPQITSEKLVKEIQKEMRLPGEGYTKLLFDKKRIQFFEKDVDETWSGIKVATTANPDLSKSSLPDARLCMVMGLGPKGLPKSYISNASYHFEFTGSNTAFETGTAMGAITSHLFLLH